jgi:hypothetical protein
MSDNLPQAVWSGVIKIAGLELKCHVLEDGRRIIEADSLNAFLEALGNDGDFSVKSEDLREFAQWMQGGLNAHGFGEG